MRSKGEGCKVNVFRREIELVAHHRPVVQRVRSRLAIFAYRHGALETIALARIGEKVTTSNRHKPS
jgi:hypothetical protein